ncbi:MAG TPA: 2-hydroxyhepta-2,4-diene-1,7-dioate isomerase [Cytophagales bacterium]|nr:2-hydroxyhepta-2,4-diene-1,7-dioate isomerase [Cytophagales bacterium]
MKIICVGMNYADHVSEFRSPKPTKPVIFMKPDTALLRSNLPFYHPDFSEEIHYECELILRICKEGKYIDQKFAHKYYDQIGLGLDFTARDLQSQFKSKGLPWELAKAFDQSAVVSSFFPKDDFPNVQNLNFSLFQNGVMKQKGNTSEMIFGVDEILSFASRFFTLKTGDIIFTGTPKGVDKIKIGDKLEAYLEDKKVLECEVK